MTTKLRLIVLIAAAITLCTAFHSDVQARPDARQGNLALEQTSFTVKLWQSDGSHFAAVKGKLTLGDRPVAGAIVQAGAQGRIIRTDEDGTFKLLVDRSLIVQKPVRVVSVQDAKVVSKPLNKDEADAVLAASALIRVYHPIEVTKVEPSGADPSRVKVHARFRIGKDDRISFFRVDKYRISGQVVDADGNPVKDAIVWIDRDSGEGFAKSTPTDHNGTYEMFYWPEEEETNLTVIVGTRRYELPKGKAINLPRNTSVDMRIRLPREGMVIDDNPSELVFSSAKGAKYTGLLAGLDVPSGTPYTVTIPDRNGRFVVTVAKDVWERRPQFFETVLTKFVAQDNILKAGDELPVGFVQPDEHNPKLLAASP